jgi:predicted DCC family thiol-disulfide oxidoreductase YuxK
MTNETRVLYNGECPVCSFEIGHYAEYAERESLPLRFEDLNQAELDTWGLTEDAAARRLHVLHKGALVAGIPAFLLLWEEMPRYRWLARVVRLPGLYHLSVFLYDFVLAPVIYRWHLRRQETERS